LQLCAQNALDIATHLAASAGRDAPDYASAIDVLGDLGVLPTQFVHRFRGVAGFRNILVHGYLGVELDRLHELLNAGLDDFVEFARYVESFLQRA
ncbi:MAG: type VII toxin-antitoxin system HepT family RNase toxin, partial [Myxococcota bacterium]